MDKYLITIQLQEGKNYTLRSVLTTEGVELEDVEFYYHSLLGFHTLNVKLQTRDVPQSFTLSLIGGKGSDIPRHFPSHDHESAEEGLDKYYALIDQVCQMERMRVECGIGGAQQAAEDVKPTSSRYVSWVNQILEQFKKATACSAADAFTKQDEEIVAEDRETIAWIFTPVLQEIRDSRGSRVITDRETGRKWVNRIGTELFPDLVVRRRFSIVDWNFQHESSYRLACMAIEWYIDAQLMGEWEGEGISPWILDADRDLAAVLTPFRMMGPRQAFHIPNSMQQDNRPREKVHPLLHIMRRLEGDVVLSPLSVPEHAAEIVSLDSRIWNKFLRHIFRMHGLATDVIDSCWGPVEDMVQTWMRSGFGIRLSVPVLFDGWSPLWKLIVESRQCLERFVLFVETLETFDPIRALNLTNTEKYDVAEKWLALFIETECMPEEQSTLASSQFYNDAREWCLKYTPLAVFDNAYKPAAMGPALTRLGYPCHKTKKGRKIVGLRYKHMPASSDILIAETSVLDMLLKTEQRSDFTVIAKNEIHLGTL